jgi:apolipoprotein N-acyltransferase
MQLRAAGEEQNLTHQQLNEIIHIAQVAGDVILVVTIIIFVLTAIGLFLLLKMKKAKTAGVLLLIAGILSLPELLVPGILLIIAGIMALVRKPKQPIDSYES